MNGWIGRRRSLTDWRQWTLVLVLLLGCGEIILRVRAPEPWTREALQSIEQFHHWLAGPEMELGLTFFLQSPHLYQPDQDLIWRLRAGLQIPRLSAALESKVPRPELESNRDSPDGNREPDQTGEDPDKVDGDSKEAAGGPSYLRWEFVASSQGYRTHEFDDHPWEGVTRVVCVGDSPMFGYRVNERATFPAVAENMLNQWSRSEFEVLNLAVPGYGMNQVARLIEQEVLALRPDAVVIGVGPSNDRLVPRSDREILKSLHAPVPLKQRLKPALWSLLFPPAAPDQLDPDIVTTPRASDDEVREDLTRAIELLRSRDIPAIVMNLCFAEPRSPTALAAKQTARGLDCRFLPSPGILDREILQVLAGGKYADLKAQFDRMMKQNRITKKRLYEGMDFYDSRYPTPENKALFFYFMEDPHHLTTFGHLVLGNNLAQVLHRLLGEDS